MDMKNKKLIQCICVVIVALILAFISYRFLPEEIAMRGGKNVSKFLYLIATFLLSIVSSVAYYFKDNKKYLYLAVLMAIIPVFTVFLGNVFNLSELFKSSSNIYNNIDKIYFNL